MNQEVAMEEDGKREGGKEVVTADNVMTVLNVEKEMRDMAADCGVAPMHVLLAAWRAFQKLDTDARIFAVEDACQEVFDLVQGRTR